MHGHDYNKYRKWATAIWALSTIYFHLMEQCYVCLDFMQGFTYKIRVNITCTVGVLLYNEEKCCYTNSLV